MVARRLPLKLLLPVGLILLVIVLGALQYRWLDQVSQAERAQLQRSLTQRVQEFTSDFDADIGLAYALLGLDFAAMGDPFQALDRHYETWKTQARFPDLVKTVYLATADTSGTPQLRRLLVGTGTGEVVDWPEHLSVIQQTLDLQEMTAGSSLLVRQVITQPRSGIIQDVPALVIPVPAAPHASNAPPPPSVRGSGQSSQRVQIVELSGGASSAAVIVELDRAVLVDQMLPALVERHFPAEDSSPYSMVVTDPMGHQLFARGIAPAPTSGQGDPPPFAADVTASFFSAPRVRFVAAGTTTSHVVSWQMTTAADDSKGAAPPDVEALVTAAAPAMSLRRRAEPIVGGNVAIMVQDPALVAGQAVGSLRMLAGWQIAMRHSAGSLDAAVAQARQRNLLISFGILSVLAFGVGLVMVNARRSETLAAQQMEFVATVSHELRTPLAVIRSAAQNLSAGVVDDPAQAKRYGDLIEGEGRRLTDMVEEVLAFAGLSGPRRTLGLRPVAIGALVDEVVSTSAGLLESAGAQLDIAIDDHGAMVMGDEESLRRAVSNLLTNAIKHGGDGHWVGVRVSRDGDAHVHVAVSDKGRGIDDADLPHVFEPFYRGRHAVEQQVQGNGLGLSLVARIAEAHGGTVSARSERGQGATVTMHLPIAQAEDAGHQ